MAKLSKTEIKEHNIAVELLKKDKLTFEEKLIVYEKWNESATSLNSEAGAFFTPYELANDFSLNIYSSATTIDLCAGIGMLSFLAYHYRDCTIITCVELNPIYYELGKKLLPEANWINTSIFNYKEFGRFDQCISNPPFGKIKTGLDADTQKDLNYKGAEFDLITVEIGSNLADYSCFILPQQSTPFKYSGAEFFMDLREQNKGYNPYGLSLSGKPDLITSLISVWIPRYIKMTGKEFRLRVKL